MPVLAATATANPLDHAPTAALLLLVTLGYLGWCAADPFARCRRCGGLGKTRTRFARRLLPCLRCDGHGIRLRVGRRFLNRLIHLHRAAGSARRAAARREGDNRRV